MSAGGLEECRSEDGGAARVRRGVKRERVHWEEEEGVVGAEEMEVEAVEEGGTHPRVSSIGKRARVGAPQGPVLESELVDVDEWAEARRGEGAEVEHLLTESVEESEAEAACIDGNQVVRSGADSTPATAEIGQT
jgi:hypothetical protein